MEIIQAVLERKFELRSPFLAPYYQKGDPFKTLLARSTYLNKYCRGGETWTDTIKRVVEGNLSLDPTAMQTEGELLFHLCWTGQVLPPGRGLWTGGIDNIPADARYNCWATTLYSIDDWCWIMNQLMLGGGVGVGLAGIHQLPRVEGGLARLSVRCRADHQDVEEVEPTNPDLLNGQTPIFCAPDSREGWVECLRRVLTAAFQGTDIIIDLSGIRPRGTPIKTFGGVACGPGPLAQLLREVHRIVRGAAGRHLTSIECLDITNYVGYCVKSGNVRRSAILVLGDADDRAFRDAKKDWEAVKSHRHTSNNSLMLRTKEQIDSFNWAELVEDNSTYGEPGIFNLWLAQQTDPGVTVINPCLTGDTRIATQFGLIPIGELAGQGQALKVTTDSRVQPDYKVLLEGVVPSHETIIRDAVPAFKTNDAVDVYRVTTARGYTIKATKGHKFPTSDGFVELRRLQLGDCLLLQSGEGQWGTAGNEEIGTIIGWIEGDGSLYEDRAILRFWGEQKSMADALLPWCQRLASTIPAKNGREYDLSVGAVEEGSDSCAIRSYRIATALAEMGYRMKGAVPEVVWRGNRDCVRGYLRGLFATDGQINWSGGEKQSFSIRLSQSNPNLLREVQVLLANFGIVSSVYKRREAGWKRMPDGKGGLKDYWCEEQFDLCISKQNAKAFAERVGFLLDVHTKLYSEWQASWVRGPYAEDFTDEIVSIDFVGVEPTYCTTQPTHHTFIAEGIVSGNCGEMPLHDREACNLAEVFPAQFEDVTDPEVAIRLAARYCLRQRLTPLLDAQSDRKRQETMRVGVGLGGLCDFEWTPELLSKWYGYARQEADSYAKDLGVTRPASVSTVKPSGTISLLNGSSPGEHAPWDAFNIRRVRTAVNDPMAYALMDAGVPYELDVYDSTNRMLVFSFPQKAISGRVTVQTQTVRDQFERQAMLQEYWSDSAVSATITFREDEKAELIQCLKDYVPRLKSTTCLPAAHGYEQAPYESIDEATYLKLYQQIDHGHPLTRGGDFEIEECSGGVCPIR